MNKKTALVLAVSTAGLTFGTQLLAQAASAPQLTHQAQVELSHWDCRSDLAGQMTPAGGKPTFVRISPGVLAAFVGKKDIPETHDLKINPEQQVFVQILVDHKGKVACARVLDLTDSSSDPILISKSLDAAKNWQFRPYYLNQQPVVAEATMTFRYKGSKVSTQP